MSLYAGRSATMMAASHTRSGSQAISMPRARPAAAPMASYDSNYSSSYHGSSVGGYGGGGGGYGGGTPSRPPPAPPVPAATSGGYTGSSYDSSHLRRQAQSDTVFSTTPTVASHRSSLPMVADRYGDRYSGTGYGASTSTGGGSSTSMYERGGSLDYAPPTTQPLRTTTPTTTVRPVLLPTTTSSNSTPGVGPLTRLGSYNRTDVLSQQLHGGDVASSHRHGGDSGSYDSTTDNAAASGRGATSTSSAAIGAATHSVPMPVGFRNLGNTCYMNAALQCLLHATGSFMESLEAAATRSSRSAPRDAPVSQALCALYRGSTSELFKIKSAVATANRQFLGTAQNDAHEFIRELLHTVHREVNRVVSKPKYVEMKDIPGESDEDAKARWLQYCRSFDDSVVYDEFGGLLRSVTKCAACSTRSLSFDPVLDLSTSVAGTSVLECMSELSRVSTLPEYKCAICKKVTAQSQNQITAQQLPRQLVVHLKRFSSSGRKNGASLSFSDRLDYPTMTGAAKATYILTGVVLHHGSSYGGHYTAYVRRGMKQDWYECDDSSVMQTTGQSVLRATAAAYLLFYTKLSD